MLQQAGAAVRLVGVRLRDREERPTVATDGMSVSLRIVRQKSFCPLSELRNLLLAGSDIIAKAKVPSQLSVERYMKCGYGLCGNCTVDPHWTRLCVEGPIVKNETARKIMESGKYHRDELGKKHTF